MPLTLTHLGHSGVLLDFAGTRILADPLFVETWMYHRGEPLGIAPADLPTLTGVAVVDEPRKGGAYILHMGGRYVSHLLVPLRRS